MGGQWANRRTDNCDGHLWVIAPGPAFSGSPDVFTNNLDQMRRTDPYEKHGGGYPPFRHLIAGSGTVFVNGLNANRQFDPLDCGALADEHSPDVKIGG